MGSPLNTTCSSSKHRAAWMVVLWKECLYVLVSAVLVGWEGVPSSPAALVCSGKREVDVSQGDKRSKMINREFH